MQSLLIIGCFEYLIVLFQDGTDIVTHIFIVFYYEDGGGRVGLLVRYFLLRSIFPYVYCLQSTNE